MRELAKEERGLESERLLLVWMLLALQCPKLSCMGGQGGLRGEPETGHRFLTAFPRPLIKNRIGKRSARRKEDLGLRLGPESETGDS